ncbi:MAG: cupin domain-containing protein, partial [bacterium]
DGSEVTVGEGDLVQFPEGLNCVWDITSDLRKVFTFEDVDVSEEGSIPVS